MDLLLSDPYAYVDALLLVFVRVLSLFLAVPFFSNRTVPYMTKIGLAFFISVITINVIDIQYVTPSTDIVNFMLAVGSEFIIGWLIGFASYIAYSSLVLAGQFIDQQIGFAMVNVFDPLSQVQLSITGNLYYYLVLLITLATNAHFYFIKGIVVSFDYIPIGKLTLSGELRNAFTGKTGFYAEFFILALRIAAPFFFVMLVTNVVLAILARTAPSMNLFVIGFPIKLLLGISLLLVTMTVFPSVADMVIQHSNAFMDQVIRGLSSR